jgi:hypothetical protein
MCHHDRHRYERERLGRPSRSVWASGADREAAASGADRDTAPSDEDREAAPIGAGGAELAAAGIRASDADRERVAALLRDHAAAGRLEPAELEDRLERTYAARYGDDLRAVLAELPPEPAPRPRPQHPASGLPPFAPLAAIGVLVAVAALTGAWWLMWLIWPILVVLGPRRHYRYRRARF